MEREKGISINPPLLTHSTGRKRETAKEEEEQEFRSGEGARERIPDTSFFSGGGAKWNSRLAADRRSMREQKVNGFKTERAEGGNIEGCSPFAHFWGGTQKKHQRYAVQ